MADVHERQDALIQHLGRLIESARERLGVRDATFAREHAEAGEWELAIETINQASRHGLLLTTSEKQELAEIQALLRRLQPATTWRSFRALVRGLLRREMSFTRPPRVEPIREPITRFDPPLLREAMPTVAAWLREGLRREGEESLAAQVDTARVHALCDCSDDSCFSFYLMPPIPVAERGHRYTGLAPEPFDSVGIDNGHIAMVQREFWGQIDAASDEEIRAFREYQALVGVVPREAV